MLRFFQTTAGKSLVLAIFFAIGGAVYVYLYLGIGGYVPFVTNRQYALSAITSDASNLVSASHVDIAGVQIGEVRTIEQQGRQVKVDFTVDSQYAPLHQGMHVRLGERSLVGESYFDITDGKGPAIPTGTVLPASALTPDVPLHDVLASLDAPTRAAMSSFFRSTGAGTAGTQQNVSQLIGGLGGLGRQGNTALDAIASQSADLESLGHDTSTLINALDTSEGKIADLVTSADRLTKATSTQNQAISATMHTLPGVLDSATRASVDVANLSGALVPVADSLQQASPFLSDALGNLPGVSSDLRGLLPSLSGTFHRAPNTFHRIPDFRSDAHDTIDSGHEFLRDLNPLLHYLQPYGPEAAGFVANFDAILNYTDGTGAQYLRLSPHLNDQSIQTPFGYNGPLTYRNPYPAPGTGAHPGPWNGKFPHVERLPE